MKINTHNNNIIIIDEDNDILSVLDSLINSVVNGFEIYYILMEKDGQIVYNSNNISKVLKMCKFTKIADAFNKDIYEDIRRLMLESIFTTNQVRSEIFLKNKYLKTIITPIFDTSLNIKYLLLNFYDISTIKRYEEEIEDLHSRITELDKIKSTFLSNVSHELKTPMNAIIGFSDLLLDKDNNSELFKRFLKSLNSNAKYLEELLNNILDYAKLETKEFDLLYENFSICDLLIELKDIFENVNYKKNLNFVKLIFELKEDKRIITDYLRLKQVLFNIISNSIKFTDTGQITISYYFENDMVIFKIQDTGIGIPKDKIKRIFEKFWQYDSSSRKEHKGAGLGLTISKDIIELLNGEITVESELKKGTTFLIKIPLEEIKNNSTTIEIDDIDFSDKTALIVDELPVDYSLLVMYLKSLHINIIESYSGKDAISIYKNRKDDIDIVFIDMNLPDMNIIDISKKIKNTNFNSIIISKSGFNDFESDFIDYHLKKPINKNELLLLLSKIWQK